jgi:hypothetical protein
MFVSPCAVESKQEAEGIRSAGVEAGAGAGAGTGKGAGAEDPFVLGHFTGKSEAKFSFLTQL